MKFTLYALAAGLAVLAAAAMSFAGPKVEADPNKEYVLTPEVGPYVVCVKGYVGPNARSLASTLVLNTRRQGFAAYVYDYSAEERRKVKEILDEKYKMAPEVARKKTIRVEENWGVLVGAGYRDLEAAGKDVDKVKKLSWDDLPKTATDIVPEMKKGQLFQVSPYSHAFATRNPLVAAAKPDPNAPDPAWKDLNSGRKYNLLKCGKPWTLAVKQFTGVNAVQARTGTSAFVDALLGKSDDTLDGSARQAEELARLLCELKMKAYVLHTRGASIVTVGGFDGEKDSLLLKTQQQIQPQLRMIESKIATDPRMGDLYKFFAQPMPMKVPQL